MGRRIAMTVGKLKILCGFLIALLIAESIFIFHYQNLTKLSEARPAFSFAHAASIERAYGLEAARNRVPVGRVKDRLYPIAVSFPNKVCIQLTPPLTSVGGYSLYCFRNGDGALIEQYQIGE